MPGRLILEVTYQEVARRLLMKQSEDAICQGTGLSLSALHGIMSRGEFKQLFHTLQTKMYKPIDEHLDQHTRNLKNEIEEACFDSFDRLMKLLKLSNSEAIIKDVAQDMLDRGGYGRKVEDNRPVINIGVLEAAVLVEALQKEDAGARLMGTRTTGDLTRAVGEHAKERRDASDAADI